MEERTESTKHRSDRPGKTHEYVVVARRYRPQDFTTLVGQDHVSQGLANAIQTNRVGHAYLFTGARGVGKTSTARIFAKALNCVRGPTTQPCGECDVCQGVASGDDVDVLEIDGASNRGIDEIRQLRQNVSIRPSRARFKIYIIDEVHMLTTQAFNALLKTLEEPPEHVKFIFCTTEADKIPITVLSRCQRFDFAPMELGSIMGRLEHIVQQEGLVADPEALQIIARRAAGSMRDSQSLLEQLMSFGGDHITTAAVHAMLGTANAGRLAEMASTLIERNAAGALQLLDRAVQEGVDVGQFAEQLLGYFRDLAAVHVGCGPELLLHASPGDYVELKTLSSQLGLETTLAAIQILDHGLARMRQSTHVRILVEMSLVRLCNLAQLDDLASLVVQLRQAPASAFSTPTPARSARVPETVAIAAPVAAPAPTKVPPANVDPPGVSDRFQKKNEITAEPPVAPAPTANSDTPLTLAVAQTHWQATLAELTAKGDLITGFAKTGRPTAISGPNTLVVTFPESYNKERCERPDQKKKLMDLLIRLSGRPLQLELRVADNSQVTANKQVAAPPVTLAQKAQRKREKERHPLVRQAMDLFDAEVEHVIDPPAETVVPTETVSGEQVTHTEES